MLYEQGQALLCSAEQKLHIINTSSGKEKKAQGK